MIYLVTKSTGAIRDRMPTDSNPHWGCCASALADSQAFEDDQAVEPTDIDDLIDPVDVSTTHLYLVEG